MPKIIDLALYAPPATCELVAADSNGNCFHVTLTRVGQRNRMSIPFQMAADATGVYNLARPRLLPAESDEKWIISHFEPVAAYLKKLRAQLIIEEEEKQSREDLQDGVDLGLAVLLVVCPESILVRVLGWSKLAYDLTSSLIDGNAGVFASKQVATLLAEKLLKKYIPVRAPNWLFKTHTRELKHLAVARVDKIADGAADIGVDKLFCALTSEEAQLSPTLMALLAIHRLRCQNPVYVAQLKQVLAIQMEVYKKRQAQEIGRR
jgi:hypothetical protein